MNICKAFKIMYGSKQHSINISYYSNISIGCLSQTKRPDDLDQRSPTFPTSDHQGSMNHRLAIADLDAIILGQATGYQTGYQNILLLIRDVLSLLKFNEGFCGPTYGSSKQQIHSNTCD